MQIAPADWNAKTAFGNPFEGDGSLAGAFDARQSDLRVSAGACLALGGGLSLLPNAEAFVGELDRQGYTVRGALSGEIPAVTQRYRGWKAGLGLASDWMETGSADMKLRPALGVSAMSLNADSDTFMMKLSDGTEKRARFADVPETVLALSAGMEGASREGGLRIRFGYAGLVSDGKVEYAVVGGLKLRF